MVGLKDNSFSLTEKISQVGLLATAVGTIGVVKNTLDAFHSMRQTMSLTIGTGIELSSRIPSNPQLLTASQEAQANFINSSETAAGFAAVTLILVLTSVSIVGLYKFFTNDALIGDPRYS
jgi:hypothetical protein